MKNSKINQKLTEKWNTVGVTKPLLTHTPMVILHFLPHFGEPYNLPQEISFHHADYHRFTHEIAY